MHDLKLLHKFAHFRDGGTAARGNAARAAFLLINAAHILAFGGGHAAGDAFDPIKLLVIHVDIFHHGSDAWKHAQNLFHGSHAAQRFQLRQKIIHGELAFGHAFGHALGFILVDFFLRLFHQADHVAHAQHAAGNALWMEWFKRVKAFAHAHEKNGRAGDIFHAERGAATTVGVELAENDAVDMQLLMERFRRDERVLTGHGINDQQCLMRLGGAANALQFAHERVIHMQATRGVDNERVKAAFTRCAIRALRHANRHANGFAIFRALVGFTKESHARSAFAFGGNLLGDDAQLFNGGGSLQIACCN